MRSKALPGWAHTLCTAAAALVFLLAYELVVYRVPVTEIFLPVSSWSDEVIYSKQLAAAVQYGAPQGYFGFNESHAAVGTYAAWGPAVFLVYALPGLLLRGQNAFLWCNLLFVVLGWTFFARAARLGWKRQLAFAAALAAMNAPIRYVFSAMQEPLHYALMLAVLGCGILARRDKSRAAWAGLCVLCAVATLVRPYEAVLWLFPLALCRQDRRRIAVCVAGGTVSLGGTLVLMSKFYAPYFFTNVDVSPLQELARGQVVSAVRDVAHKLLDALRTVAEMLADQLANRSGGQYLLFFLLLGVTLVCLIVDARAGRPVFWKGCAAVTAVIVFLALLLMYRPVEGSRHTLVLDVLLLADSTSRWAQAMREMSGRLEEIPGEEAFPAYLESVIASFYERAGKVRLKSGKIASVTIGGTVSPAGGNFEEPVTQATLKVVGAFHGLSRERSDARKYPAIHPIDSWSKYRGVVDMDRVEQARAILKRSNEINQMMKVIGEEGTSAEDYIVYQKGELLDAVYLQQNSFDPIDAACDPDRQIHEFNVLYDVLTRDFALSDKKEIRAFFNQVRQEFLDWHNTVFRTPEFEAQEKRLKDFYLSKAAD